MSHRTRLVWPGLLLATFILILQPRAKAALSPVDCNCMSNLPALQATCPGIVPDLCAIATNCFSTNLLAGSCTQTLPAGMQLFSGTYLIQLNVLDLQSNSFACAVPFLVLPPVPVPALTVVCPTNKTVECGSGWTFDPPTVLTFCCSVAMPATDVVVSNGICSQVITRTWQVMDGCGGVKTCSQTVTVVDTTPPGTQCGMNLVPNGNFESYTNCPNANSQFDFLPPWFTPSGGTSDYFNSCSQNNLFSTPTNLLGVQTPFSGQGYAGAVVWSTYGLNPNNTYRNYREYLEVPLLTLLTPGQKYQVSFRVSRADNCRYAIAELGARFSPGPLLDYGAATNFNVVPQVENPSTNLLAATNSWMLVQGTYIATGGESYLTIGNFRTDAATTFATNNPAGSYPDYAYYYFDDVAVVALCDSGMTNKTVACGSAWAIDPLPVFDSCSGGNVSISATTVTNGYCPRVITRTWSLADQCGNSNTLTQTVTIVDTNPPILLCAAGANLVANPQFENFAWCPFYFNQVQAAVPWFNPTIATPDYLNACTTFAPVSVPNNLVGVQTPFSGQGYMGAFVYSSNAVIFVAPGGYREYIEAQLSAPLIGGVTYQVSFRVSLADYSGWAIAEIGAHFSTGPIYSNFSQGVLSYVPQVVNPSGNLLTSTNGWMLVQGTFTAAGGEDHITLGNFLTDANTTAVPAAGTNNAYYYYDDVSVVALCNGSFTNKTAQCGVAWDFDTPLAFDECSGDFLSTSIVSTTTNGTCPIIATRVWTISDACMNSITATQTVTVVDTTPPVPLCSGANLVPNPSFENYGQCPTTSDALSEASPWYRPTDGTADYFNACAPGVNISVPTNFVGVQTAFTGQAYAGAFLYNNPGGNDPTNSYREYLQTPLLTPLIAGQSYTVSFYVNRCDNHAWAIAQIGAHFSVGPITNYIGMGNVMQVTPQVENPSGNLLASSNAWMLIQGTFIAAGGENFMTLGNFRSDPNTTAVLGGGPYAGAAYYLFDEISVVASCPPTNTLVPCGSPWTFNTPVGFDQCSGSNVTVSIASTITNSLCPLNVKRTWTLTDLCGNTNTWSQTVTATASTNAPLMVNCGCLQDGALALLTTNACAGIIPNLSVLSNSPCISGGCGSRHVTQSPPAGTVVGVGYHPITVTIFDCSGNTNTCVLPFLVSAPPPIITCPPNLVLLTCTTSAIANFTVTATGNAGTVVCSPPSGTAFPLGTNLVTCTATSSCGGVAVCGFNVIVRPQTARWACATFVIGVEVRPIGSTKITYLATLPGGGLGVNFDNLGSSGQDGMRLLPGAAQKLTFSTVLDFAAPVGARIDLATFDAANGTSEPLLSFVRSCQPHCGWNIKKPNAANPGDLYRSIAISDDGELFSSFTQDAATLDTNVLASITSMNGSTSAVMTVTLDCLTREITLAFSECDWTADNARKGWDGCIYGNGPRGSKTNKTARLILTPLNTAPPPPITTVDLLASNLTTVAFDNPSIGAVGRKWGDGHVTLMKAYDDGTAEGLEFLSFGQGGGVSTDLGHAASFQFRIAHLATNPVPNAEEIYRIKGWPPGTTTNRPPPPAFDLRLAQSGSGFGVDCSADFTQWGVSKVTVQLWNGAALVAETKHIPATLASSLVTLGGFPGIISCPGVSYVSLSDTNPLLVFSGLPCPVSGCAGTELRILPEFNTSSILPVAFTELTCLISEDLDNLLYRIETAPACTPIPLDAMATPDGVHLNWSGDGFHLQGAESLNGPWYDLGASPPVTLPANSTVRIFRLRCE